MKFGETNSTLDKLLCAGVLLFGIATLLSGCGVSPVRNGSDGSRGDSTSTVTPPNNPSGENDTVASTVIGDGPFENLKLVTFADDVTVTLEGNIAARDTVEAFDIGPVGLGDRLVLTAEAVDTLDPVMAVFDANGDAMIVNDDRSYYGGDFNSAIDVQSRRDTAHCYVAVAASDGSRTTGGYRLSLRRVPGGTPPETRPQQVYLNFDGADAIVIGRREPVSIPVFEGSLVGEEFAGRTEELIDEIVAQIRRDYVGLNVEFVSSREGSPPGESYTTIHFGAYDPGLLGLADYVDEFNAVPTQKAIVFVDTFQAFLPLNPSVEEMANALSNVAAHETGHLLGLNHAVDPHGIMDITANLRQMLAVQTFCRSPFHQEVFPVGHQDAAQLLVEAVGGDLAVVKAAAAEQRNLRAAWYDQGEPMPARLDRPFSTCNSPTYAKHHHFHQDQD